MSGKRKREPHERAAEELLSQDDGNEPEESGEPEETEAEAAPKDGDELPVDQPSRRERRQDRFRERVLQDVEERIGSRLATLHQQLQQLSQQPQRHEPPPQQGPDQFTQQVEARLKGIYDQQDAISATFKAKSKDGTLTDAEHTEMTNKVRKLNEDAQELITARAARKFGLGRQQDPEEAARQAIVAQTRAKHADVYGHQDADAMVRYADGYFQQMVSKAQRMGRQVNGPELLDEALDKAREEWGMQPRNRRNRERPEAERRKFTATPSSGGGSGSGEGRTVKLTKDIRAIADAAFPHIKDDAKRYAHWAKTAGKRLVSGGDD